jgi:tetratricopeptide (TPR) repeat protein
MQRAPKYVAAVLLGIASVGALSMGVSAVAVAADEQPKQPKVSKGAAKGLKAAQEAMNAKNFPEAIAKLKEVEAVSGLTPDDQYLMNEMYGFSYIKTGDLPQAAKYLEANLNSPFLDAAAQQTRVKALFQVNYQAKNYDKAIEFGSRAIKEGFADEEIEPFVVQAYYLKGDYQTSLKTGNEFLDRLAKAGKTPTEQQVNLVVSSCVKLKDDNCTTHALERMVEYYPKPEYWSNIVYTLLQAQTTGQDKSMLNVYRLATEVDALQRPDDYTELAQLAIEQGSPGEAVRALEKGFAKGVFKDSREKERNQRLLESAKKQAATDQAQLAKLEKDSAAGKTGDRDVGLGLAYLSYEQYPKAVEALSRGLTKGGVRNEAEARLLLGIAQLKSGNKAEATKSFEQVKGNPTLERLANLWTLHAKQAPTQTASAQ